MINRSDWQLHPVIFNRMTHLFGPMGTDLFASCLTVQCPAFFSWWPDLYAVATDAFRQDWSQIKEYANPLWSLIGRVLSKVQMDKVRIALVVPVWKTQPWYPLLLQMQYHIWSNDADQPGSRPSASRMALIKPYKAVTSSTITRWLKYLLEAAGIYTSVFSAHSVRGASFSAAANLGIMTKGCRLEF